MNTHTQDLGCLTRWARKDASWPYAEIHSEECTAAWREFSLTADWLELELREADNLEKAIEMAISILCEGGVPTGHKSLLEAMAWIIRYADADDPKLLPFRKEFAKAILLVTDAEYLAHRAIKDLDFSENAEALFASGPLAQFFRSSYYRSEWVRAQTAEKPGRMGVLALDYLSPDRSDEYYDLQQLAVEGKIGV